MAEPQPHPQPLDYYQLGLDLTFRPGSAPPPPQPLDAMATTQQHYRDAIHAQQFDDPYSATARTGLLGLGGGGATGGVPPHTSGHHAAVSGVGYATGAGGMPTGGGVDMMTTSMGYMPAGATTAGAGLQSGAYYSSAAVNMTGRPATNAFSQEYDLATTTAGGPTMNWTGGRTWDSTKETRFGTGPPGANTGPGGAATGAGAARGTQSLDITYDFTRPEGSRTRPLICEGRSLYVCEHNMSIWSPVLKTFIIECPNRELILPNIRYDYMLDVLETISPMHKDVTEKNLHYILPIASEFQMEGLLHRCELYLMDNVQFPILEKLWLADRYKLKRLLHQCLKEIRPQSRIDISGPKYYTLSDRVKVMVLERIQGAKSPDAIAEPPVDASVFHRMNETNYASIKGKNGRAYYCNPYYLAAWSNLIADRMNSQNLSEFACGCTQEELKLFLMTIYPPQLRITEHNVAPILMAACKLESPAVMRRCANMILNPAAQLSVFAKLALLDRCFMHELLDTCLRGLRLPEQALEMTQQGTYDCLSTKARAAILDRLSVLLKNPGLAPHRCHRCQQCAACDSVNWVCPNCGSYCSAGQTMDMPAHVQQQQRQQQGGGAGGAVTTLGSGVAGALSQVSSGITGKLLGGLQKQTTQVMQAAPHALPAPNAPMLGAGNVTHMGM